MKIHSLPRHIPMGPVNDTGAAFGVSTFKGEGPWKGLTEETFQAYESLGRFLDTDPQHMVRPEQKHTDLVLKVDESMGGQGVLKEEPRPAADGLITDVPGMALCVVTADCVPVALVDPVRKAIGLVHSGWRGTAACISLKALKMMEREYGTKPGDVIVWIGPYICGKCYEVGEELIPHFQEFYTKKEILSFFKAKDNGKYLLDMVRAITLPLVREGISLANVYQSGLCTFENAYLNSYRRDGKSSIPCTGRNLTALVLRG